MHLPTAPSPHRPPSPTPAAGSPIPATPGTAIDEDGTGARSGATRPARPRSVAAALLGVCTHLLIGAAVALLLSVLALSVGPRFFPYQTATVLTGSMEPALPVGAILIFRPEAAAQLAAGDIISFQRPDRPGELVTHRIVAIEEGERGRLFRTKGDANAFPDSWQVVGTGQGWRCVVAIPYLGEILGTLQQPPVRLILVIVPAVALGGLTLRDIWRPQARARVSP